jgi:hypothetical protein
MDEIISHNVATSEEAEVIQVDEGPSSSKNNIRFCWIFGRIKA